jgi:hypothetical protein
VSRRRAKLPASQPRQLHVALSEHGYAPRPAVQPPTLTRLGQDAQSAARRALRLRNHVTAVRFTGGQPSTEMAVELARAESRSAELTRAWVTSCMAAVTANSLEET